MQRDKCFNNSGTGVSSLPSYSSKQQLLVLTEELIEMTQTYHHLNWKVQWKRPVGEGKMHGIKLGFGTSSWTKCEKNLKNKVFMCCVMGGSAHRTTWLLSTQLLQVSLVQGHSARGLHARPSPSSLAHESQPTTAQLLALSKSKIHSMPHCGQASLTQKYTPLFQILKYNSPKKENNHGTSIFNQA